MLKAPHESGSQDWSTASTDALQHKQHVSAKSINYMRPDAWQLAENKTWLFIKPISGAVQIMVPKNNWGDFFKSYFDWFLK